MKIVVCVKPVKAELISSDQASRGGMLLNPYDQYALDCALQCKKSSGAEVICIAMGAASAEKMMTDCIAIGADRAILLCDKALIGSDTVATSYALACAISMVENVDYIFCGERSVDGETGQVPFGISERLKLTPVYGITRVEGCEEASMIVSCQTDSETVVKSVKRRAVLIFERFTTLQPSISLLAIKKAKRQGVELLSADDLGLNKELCGNKGSKTTVLNVQKQLSKKECVHLAGSGQEIAASMIKLLPVYANKKLGGD